jgi:lysyl-tRNA synthetase class I
MTAIVDDMNTLSRALAVLADPETLEQIAVAFKSVPSAFTSCKVAATSDAERLEKALAVFTTLLDRLLQALQQQFD